jgi:hypothetical protein
VSHLRRLSLPTFKQLVSQLPTDHFVENLPQSLPILEAFYSKLFLAGYSILLFNISALL